MVRKGLMSTAVLSILWFAPDAAAQQTPTGVRIGSSAAVNVRSGPGWWYPLLGQIPASLTPCSGGQVYLSTGTVGAWRRIWWDGREGWVPSVYATPVPGIYAARVRVPVASVMISAFPGLTTVGQVYRDQEYSIATGWYWGTTKIRWGGKLVKVPNTAVEWVLR